MNSKRLNSILITALIIIWSIIGYRYFIQNSNNTIHFDTVPLIEKKSFLNSERKNFTLVKLKRDPFLGKIHHARNTFKKNISKKKSKSKRQRKNKSQPLPIPEIQYLGFLYNKKNDTKRIILRINGKIETIKESTDFKNLFHVKKAHQDSVEIIINNKTKIFNKSQ